jgi:uncharacterized membrane protein YphA (DoxX/SURF4 family)
MLYPVPVGIVLSYLVVHARWIVGAVLLLAGLSKISHLSKFIETIKLTGLIPIRLQREIAYTIVVLECVLGVCLLLGAKVTLTAALASGLFSSFTFVVFINLKRNNIFDCNCFGPYFQEKITMRTVMRNLTLLLLSLIILQFYDGYLAIETLTRNSPVVESQSLIPFLLFTVAVSVMLTIVITINMLSRNARIIKENF